MFPQCLGKSSQFSTLQILRINRSSPGHGSSPHLRGGWGGMWTAHSSTGASRGELPMPGGESSPAAQHPEGGGQGKPPQRDKEGLDVRGLYALRPFPSAAHPSSSPRDAVCASPTPEAAPGVPRGSLDTPRAAPAPQFHRRARGWGVLTFSQRLARLQLRASRLQGHFSFPEACPARFRGRARQPVNLCLREGGKEGGWVIGVPGPANPSRGVLTGCPGQPWPHRAQPRALPDATAACGPRPPAL